MYRLCGAAMLKSFCGYMRILIFFIFFVLLLMLELHCGKFKPQPQKNRNCIIEIGCKSNYCYYDDGDGQGTVRIGGI